MPNPAKIPYNKTNLRRVIASIKRNLTSDLLPKKWVALNEKNTMFGHCHTASGCLYKIFGANHMHLYRSYDDSCKLVDEGMYHWWAIDTDGNLIDITASQYSKHPRLLKSLYRVGTKSGVLGFAYKQRVNTLLSRVTKDLGI